MDMLPDHDTEIERVFPGLNRKEYRITSPIDIGYNCIAWAAEIDSQWWWPDPLSQYFWPSNVPRVCTIEAFIQAYSLVGYEVCDSPDFETGYDKVLIYTDSQGTPTHASRQLDAQRWTSKLGQAYDISHSFGALNGTEYGAPAVFMRRKKKADTQVS